MIEKMEERRKWKRVNTEDGRKKLLEIKQ